MEKQREWRVAVFPTPVSDVGCHFVFLYIPFSHAFLNTSPIIVFMILAEHPASFRCCCICLHDTCRNTLPFHFAVAVFVFITLLAEHQGIFFSYDVYMFYTDA